MNETTMNLKKYRYMVTKQLKGVGIKTFEIIITAVDPDDASVYASAIGFQLGLMLVGPL